MSLAAIAAAFARARSEQRAALMPYWSLGFPDADTSVRVVEALARAGADLVELGVPFSDPLADGPVIQRANQIALDRGISVEKCLELTRRIRAAGVTIPLMAMGYMNPILAFGEERYVEAWRAAGADGLIIPDLPPEESDALAAACAARDMALIQFTAPTSTERRIRQATVRAAGFIYSVSVAGTTGARGALPPDLAAYIARVKAHAGDTPVAVGFGISTAEHVRQVGSIADGAIVGAALIRAAGDAADPAQAAFEFVQELKNSK
jgi:tryptophan synthase alpha chain